MRALVILTSLAVLFFAVWIFPAYRFVGDFRKRLSGKYDGETSLRREIRIAEADLVVHFYPHEGSEVSLILVPGLHPDGIYDPRFIAFAESVAQAGFNVITPDIIDLRELRITERPITQLAQLIQSLPQYLPEGATKKLGLLGVSYGAGPVFAVASEEGIKSKIDFLVTIGAYSELLNAVDFMLGGIHPRIPEPRKVHPWGRLIFAYHYVDELLQAPDSRILKESLGLRLNSKDEEAREKEKELSAEGQRFLKEVLEGFSKERRDQIRKILEEQGVLSIRLSPKAALKNLNPRTRIYLLHGRTDDLIPYEETLGLDRELKAAGFQNVHTLITGSLTHTDTITVAGLGESLRLLFWARRLLSEH